MTQDGITAAPQGYRGHVDAIEPVLSGWVIEITQPAAAVGFTISIDRHRCASVIADSPRSDVAAAGLATRNCGFSVELPARFRDGREHELALLLPDGCKLGLPGLPPSVALGLVVPELLPASAVSLDDVLDLLRRNDLEAGHDSVLVAIENATAFNSIRVPEQGFLFYARAGGRLVAYGRLDRGQGAAAEIGVVALTVLAAYRRKGLGEGLMRLLLHSASRAKGLRQVWLSVRPENRPAVHLYRKLGFRVEPAHPLGDLALPGELTMVLEAAKPVLRR